MEEIETLDHQTKYFLVSSHPTLRDASEVDT